MKLLGNILSLALLGGIAWLIGYLLSDVILLNRDYRLCCMLGAIILTLLVVIPQIIFWGSWRSYANQCFGITATVYAFIFFVLAMIGRY